MTSLIEQLAGHRLKIVAMNDKDGSVNITIAALLDATKPHYIAMPVVMELADGCAPAPAMTLLKADAVQLMDALYSCGIRPTPSNKDDQSDKLKAMKDIAVAALNMVVKS